MKPIFQFKHVYISIFYMKAFTRSKSVGKLNIFIVLLTSSQKATSISMTIVDFIFHTAFKLIDSYNKNVQIDWHAWMHHSFQHMKKKWCENLDLANLYSLMAFKKDE